ncbi:MAG TPA: septal ring lytic transglycosylase RlpA family protein [Solirubrobacteraceae bacterium]|nr:septal ring lytic transglycosylase RlpA family protein [Solirubrobacteraceae bacterium]
MLFIAYACAAVVPPPARSADPQGTDPTASAARVGVSERRLNVRSGSRVLVTGAVRPGGVRVALQIRRRGRWLTLDRARASSLGRYVLRARLRRPMSAPVRVRVSGVASGGRALGRLNVYRYANASWYGPGFFGRRTGCGGRLGIGQLGVAHKTLPCGTRITLRHGGHSVRVPVIDRGPYSGMREYDLTAATARRLHFRGHGSILTTR